MKQLVITIAVGAALVAGPASLSTSAATSRSAAANGVLRTDPPEGKHGRRVVRVQMPSSHAIVEMGYWEAPTL